MRLPLSVKKKNSDMVEETDSGRNVDLLLDPESVSGIRIEVYRHFYFGFVGYSLDLCSSWLCHLLGPSGGEGKRGRDKVARLVPSTEESGGDLRMTRSVGIKWECQNLGIR